jgi:hypothetical protein
MLGRSRGDAPLAERETARPMAAVEPPTASEVPAEPLAEQTIETDLALAGKDEPPAALAAMPADQRVSRAMRSDEPGQATVVVWVEPRDDGEYSEASQTLDTWWDRVGEERATGPGFCKPGSTDSPEWSFRVPPCEMPQLVRTLAGVVEDPERVRVHMNINVAASDSVWRMWESPCPDTVVTAVATPSRPADTAARASPAYEAMYDTNLPFAYRRGTEPPPAAAPSAAAPASGSGPGTLAEAEPDDSRDMASSTKIAAAPSREKQPAAGRLSNVRKPRPERTPGLRSAGRPLRDRTPRGTPSSPIRPDLAATGPGEVIDVPPSSVALVPGGALGVRCLGSGGEPGIQLAVAQGEASIAARSARSVRLQVFVLCPEQPPPYTDDTRVRPAIPASRPGG